MNTFFSLLFWPSQKMKFSKIIERKEIELNLSIQFFYEAFHRHKKAEQIAANLKSFWEFFFSSPMCLYLIAYHQQMESSLGTTFEKRRYTEEKKFRLEWMYVHKHMLSYDCSSKKDRTGKRKEKRGNVQVSHRSQTDSVFRQWWR